MTLHACLIAAGVRLNPRSQRLLERYDRDMATALRLACEFGFRQGEKGHNLERTLQLFEKTLR